MPESNVIPCGKVRIEWVKLSCYCDRKCAPAVVLVLLEIAGRA
jgi:hypothetical protein